MKRPRRPQTPSPKDIESFALYESRRYKAKGFGFVFAVLQWVFFIYFSVNYQKEIYAFVFGERYRSIEDPISRHYHFKTEVAAVVFIGLHTFYAILYSLKMPFFEKYKIDPSPWPWELENWSELKWYLIKSLAFNHLVTYPVI